MKEDWIKIENELIPNGKYEVSQIMQNCEGVSIYLYNESTNIKLLFENNVLALRVCDEGDRLNTVNEVLLEFGSDFFVSWPLYLVRNSVFANWFESETYGIRTTNSFKHLAIVTPNDIVDILSVTDPIISIEKYSK